MRRGSVYVAPPPVGGWNARDPLAVMDEKDAVVLDNIFPDNNEVGVRKGYETFISSGMGSGEIKTLAAYNYQTTNKLLACANSNIYEVSTGTATSLASGLTNDAWQTVNFGSRTLLFNGSDTEKSYNGSTVSNAGWTGPTAGTLFTATVFKSRVYALEKNSQSFWYGGVGAVTGAMTEFDLSAVAGTFGGNVAAIGSITLDAGDGVDDNLFICMSTGDVFIYQGSDPSADFALVGVFHIGQPVGNRPTCRVGAETLVITKDGIVPVSQIISKGRLAQSTAVSAKIQGAMDASLQAYADSFGWQLTFYPEGNKVICNVPKSGGYQQYVVNATTGAWCRFTGINAAAWCKFGDDLYFGGTDGKIYKAETGYADNGAAIEVKCKQAFTYVGAKTKLKLFSGCKLNLRSSGRVQVLLTINTDYKARAGRVTFYSQAGSGTEWDSAEWDSFSWGGSETTRGKWKLVTGKGYAVQVEINASPNGQSLSWQDTAFIYNPAGML